MSIQFRNKEGKVNDQPSGIHHEGGTRDDIILDKDGVKEILAKYFQQQYGHDNLPEIDFTFLQHGYVEGDIEMLAEIEFTEIEIPIPF